MSWSEAVRVSTPSLPPASPSLLHPPGLRLQQYFVHSGTYQNQSSQPLERLHSRAPV